MNLLDDITYKGPWILTIVVAWRLLSSRRWPFFIAFLTGFWANNSLNALLKGWIREPRPKSVDLMAAQDRDPFGDFWRWIYGPNRLYLSKAHIWGMPSGHAQMAAFAIGIFYLVFENKLRFGSRFDIDTLIFSGMCLLFLGTLYQRWESNAHTAMQLLVGSCVGVVFAGIVVYGVQWVLTKNRVAILDIKIDKNREKKETNSNI